jgi:hypothetical protein
MKPRLKTHAVLIGAILVLSIAAGPALTDSTTTPKSSPLIHRAPNPKPTAAYMWLEVLLEASGRDVDKFKPRPTILSRTMAIVLTSMYDAWAAYDEKAVGTRLGGKLRRPKSEHTKANKEKAIAYAAYHSLLFVYKEDAQWIREQMKKKGFDPDNDSKDVKTPEGIGNAAAEAVIAYRSHDGANQLGDEAGGDGTAYSDYTFYRAVNKPDVFTDPTCWLPIEFADGNGGKVTPGFLTAQWYRVKPFALKTGHQFRAPAPPKYPSEQLKKEVDEAIRVNAELTLEQKATVEFMRDGPRSTGQSGHWLQFAQDVSRRDNYDLDQDVKLFFAVSNVVMDAFISCWDTKRFYDTSRPYWWARIYYKGKKVRGWGGPGKGAMEMLGENWVPYSPDTFITPPFPGYTSGHATASGAASKMLELFTGSDHYNAVENRKAGELTEAEFTTALMQSMDGKPGVDIPESNEVSLKLPTFSATAEMAAMSRLWGGYHIRTDNEEGLKAGRAIALYSWPIYQAYFNGTK